jgi:hypothetical protein
MTPSYMESSLEERIHGLAGDPAENAFRRYMATEGKLENQHYYRIGYDRTDTSTAFLATLPLVERYRPDFIQIGGHYWEVQGYGHKQTILFKREKIEVQWKHYAGHGQSRRQLRFFLYDSSRDAALVMPVQTVLWALRHADSVYDENAVGEGKAAWTVPADVFRERLVVDALDVAKKLLSDPKLLPDSSEHAR